MFDTNYSLADLMSFACQDKDIKEVAALLGRGVNVDDPCENDRTPLMIASEYGAYEIMELLLSKGADVSKRDDEGNTALHMVACGLGQLECAHMLIEAGAEVDALNFDKQTCALIQVEKCIEDKTRHNDLLMYLFENGADPHTQNHAGVSLASLVDANKDLFSDELVGYIKAKIDQKVISSSLPDERGKASRKTKI